MKRLILAFLLTFAFISGTAAGAGYMYSASPDNPVSSRGCVIRFDQLSSSGKSVTPRILVNSTHYCVGISSVSVDWGNGNLVLSGTDGPVVVAFAEEDETFSRWGIMCGPSGGPGKTQVACYDDGVKVPAYSKRLYSSSANLWVGVQSWTP